MIACIALAMLAAACASAPPKGTPEYDEFRAQKDPLRPMNEAVLDFNMAADKVILRPVAKTYLKVVPKPARSGLSNFLSNLLEPWTAVNDILQGKPGAASRAMSRFLVNSTIGIGGLFDPASKYWKIEEHKEDFGQTLAVWGVPSGPYVMLPFFGPSSVRDSFGLGVEFFADPVGIAIDEANVANIGGTDISWLTVGRITAGGLDWRAQNDDLFEELYQSSDPYALARSAFWQLREFEITDGAVTTSEEEEQMFDELDDEFDDYDDYGDFDDFGDADEDGSDYDDSVSGSEDSADEASPDTSDVEDTELPEDDDSDMAEPTGSQEDEQEDEPPVDRPGE